MNTFPLKLVKNPHIEEAAVIVLFDTNTLQQLDEWGERVKKSDVPLVVIDHHTSHSETQSPAEICIIRENASSTCEIVYQLFKEMEIQLNEIEAKALFLGIAFDTRHFLLAKSSTFKAVADLINSGVNAEETLLLLALPMGISERIARLKACQRAKLAKIDGWVIASSSVKAYQASAARNLVASGADVAFVAGRRAGNLQISIRSKVDFCKKTGIHLGRDLAKPLGEYLNGMGGGHTISAGANGKGKVDPTLKLCLKLLKNKFN
jgi:nanoRNase/pAp phosphatase (c-di-AMP/oligoRNAs hydrolase)